LGVLEKIRKSISGSTSLKKINSYNGNYSEQ